MRHPSRFGRAAILTGFLLALFAVLLAPAPGRTQSTPVRPPPPNTPEIGLPGSKKPTTRPGSHESSAKDERDRVAGKFPAPKQKGDQREEERPGGTAYVDVTVLDPERQAAALTRDDFRVTVDGQPRKIVSVHYVFRGPQALDAGRSVAVGKGVVARGDESRTIVMVVDENSFPAGEEKTLAPTIAHTLNVTGPLDRAAFLTVPQAASVKFAGAHTDLLASASHVVGRATGAAAERSSLYALARVFTDLVRVEGPKQILFFSAGGTEAAARPATNDAARPPGLGAAVDAAAASRSTVHAVTPAGRVESSALHSLMRSTGGTVTRVTGQGHDLEPLAAALLGGYLLEIESNANDRDGRPHALSITTAHKGVHVLAATRWVPRNDPLPPLIVPTLPPG